jgi:hypothetical protein
MSPEVNQEKTRQAILERIRKDSDLEAYALTLENNPKRQALKERIRAIKEAEIDEIKIKNPERIEKEFLQNKKILKPRHARDVGRVISLVKACALLNLWHRKIEGSSIIANDDDISYGWNLWQSISKSQELNLPPYVYNLYQDIFLPLLNVAENGVSRQLIIKRHFEVYERPLADWQLRREILPLLEMAGLIIQEPDPNDKRKMLIILSEKYVEPGTTNISCENIDDTIDALEKER